MAIDIGHPFFEGSAVINKLIGDTLTCCPIGRTHLAIAMMTVAEYLLTALTCIVLRDLCFLSSLLFSSIISCTVCDRHTRTIGEGQSKRHQRAASIIDESMRAVKNFLSKKH